MAGSTVNATQGNAPALGVTAKATSTPAGTASGAVQIRAPAPAGKNLLPALVTIVASTNVNGAATAGVGNGFHVVFGDANVGAPTDSDMIIDDSDGWVTLAIPANATHFRVKGEAGTGSVGSVYAYICE